MLTGDSQTLPAGGQDPYPRSGSHDRPGQRRRGVEHMLAVVQHHQQAAGTEEVDDGRCQGHPLTLNRPHGGRHHLDQFVAVGRGGQLTHPRPVSEPRRQLGRHLEGQTGLSHPPDAGQRHQPGHPQLLGHRRQLHLSADERVGQKRQVPRQHVQRAQRLEGALTDLEHPHRGRQIPQPVLAQVDDGHLPAEQRGGGLRAQHLPTMADRHQPGRLIHRRAEIVAARVRSPHRCASPSAPVSACLPATPPRRATFAPRPRRRPPHQPGRTPPPTRPHRWRTHARRDHRPRRAR